MKTLKTILTGLMLFSLSSVATAQSPFSQSGSSTRNAPAQMQGQSSAQPQQGWNEMINRARAGQPERKGLSWPKFDLFKGNSQALDYSNDSKPGMFGSFPKLFPPREPGQPSMFGEFAESSKMRFMESTANIGNWARETNAKMKARTMETWDRVTGGLGRPFEGLGAFGGSKLDGPPVRSARNMSGKPRDKF